MLRLGAWAGDGTNNEVSSLCSMTRKSRQLNFDDLDICTGWKRDRELQWISFRYFKLFMFRRNHSVQFMRAPVWTWSDLVRPGQAWFVVSTVSCTFYLRIASWIATGT